MERRFQIEGHECRIVAVANADYDPANPKKTDHLFDTPSLVEQLNVEAFFDGECVYGTYVCSNEDFTESMNRLCGLLVVLALQLDERKHPGAAIELLKDLQFV